MSGSKKLTDPAQIETAGSSARGRRPFDWSRPAPLEDEVQDRLSFDPSAVHFLILIPVYKHSVVLVEAIETALAQKIDGGLCVVIVNDGCPHFETDDLCTVLSQSRAGIVYLHKPNGGPSSARNFAIDYAVDHFPNLQAAFFLDADNRLSVDAFATGVPEAEANE